LKKSDYFGEIALVKKCKRTATVISNSYATVAELSKESFDRISLRYPFIHKELDKRIRKLYNDKWKRFIKRSVKSIDYLYSGIPDKVIDDISYLFEIVVVEENGYLFKSGTP